ncbi:hypothetical protein Agub_g13003 [Astrephomene gubernaculifera]|uniref:Uncharacterized protein n=1 Tax=Astrephomene gubernaculifera TaxID=47775 RepID=A0AAD3E176_9CHLO|nr:hypothetical protein Agub_g13003 [Astrephomene gubernaculifera]
MEANDLKIIKDMGEHIRCLLGVGQGAPMETVKARLRQAVQVKAKNMRRCSKPKDVNLDTVDEEEGLQPASPSAPGEEEEPATPEVPKPYMWAKLPGGDTEKYAAADNHLDWLADFDIGDNAGCILVGSLDKDELVPVTLGCGLLLDPLVSSLAGLLHLCRYVLAGAASMLHPLELISCNSRIPSVLATPCAKPRFVRLYVPALTC